MNGSSLADLTAAQLEQQLADVSREQEAAAQQCKRLREELVAANALKESLQAQQAMLRQELRSRASADRVASALPVRSPVHGVLPSTFRLPGREIVRRVDVIKQGWAFAETSAAGGLTALRGDVYGEWNVFPWPLEAPAGTALIYRRHRHVDWDPVTKRWFWFADLLGFMGEGHLSSPAMVDVLSYALPRQEHIPQALWAEVLARTRWRQAVPAERGHLLPHLRQESPAGLAAVYDSLEIVMGSGSWAPVDFVGQLEVVLNGASKESGPYRPSPMPSRVQAHPSEPRHTSRTAAQAAAPVEPATMPSAHTPRPNPPHPVTFDAERVAALRADSGRARATLASLDEEGEVGLGLEASTPGSLSEALRGLLGWLVTAESHALPDFQQRVSALGLSVLTALQTINCWADGTASAHGTELGAPALECDEAAGLVWVDVEFLAAALV